MLPKKFTYEVDKSNQVVAWILHENLTYEEAIEARVGCTELISSNFPKGAAKVLCDHRPIELEGKQARLSIEASQESAKLMGWLGEYCSQVAVICGSMMMQSQMNRLAKESGLDAKLKAFWGAAPGKAAADALQYLGISRNNLIK